MWGAISRLFHKNGKSSSLEDESNGSVMDRQDHRRFKDRDTETYESRLAKQRATLKWMLLKAFNNRVPENLREPFYKDHQEQEHLKPQLVHYLASAELYCMALSNIYSDPNYNSLNHTGVIQALARKGVCLSDPLVTETTLIQTTPIKLSVHQVVMQGVMNLYSREVATPDLVSQAVHRFLPNVDPPPLPPDHEHALLLWINKAVEALKLRIQHEGKEDGAKLSELSPASELSELCDGAGLAALLSFYCPEVVHWNGIVATQLPTVSDCVRNLSLVRNFCTDYLPSDIFLMQPEEVYYMRASMKHNLVVFLADLFNMLEINPAKCVTLTKSSAQPNVYEGRNCQGVLHKRSLPQQVTGIPDLRSSLDTPSSFSGSPLITPGSLKKHQNHYNAEHPSDNRNGGVGGGGDSDFVVHRGKGVTTLSSVIHGTHDLEPAGKPTNWGDNRKQSFAGRRSRRNSLSEDSQLTLENLCGSQENLHLLGRNPDKEPAVHLVRRDSNPDLAPAPPSPVHTTNGAPEVPPRRSLSRNNSFVESQRRAQETRSSVGIQQSLLEPTPPSSPLATPIPDDEEYPRRTRQWVQQNWKKKEEEELATLRKELAEEMRPDKEKKVTTFAALPNNTTTWQSISNNQVAETNPTPDNGVNESGETGVVGSQLINIRMKLEEKRRRIENEKKRMEAQLNRQRQKLGKEAFLQAISKGKAVKSPDSDPGKESEPQHKPARPFSLQDISEVEQKWLKGDVFIEERKTPDIENMDIESYQRSIAQMDSSLHEIQADLQRLSFDGNNPGNMSGGGGLHQTPALQSFASLNQAPTYNNIKYINNIPQPPPNHPVNQGEFGNNGTITHNMFNNQGRLDGSPYQQPYHRPYQQSPQSVNNDYVEPRYPSNYQQNNAYPPDPRINNYQDPRYQDMRPSYVDTRQQVNNWNQDLRLTSGNYQQEMRMNTGYQDQRQGVGIMPPQHVNSYQERPGSLPNNYPPEPPARRQWDPPQPPPSHYENYSPRYLEGQGSSYGSESGYGGSKTEDSSSTRTKGEFYLHEPSPSHRQRPTWNHPTPPTDTTSWIHQRREPVSLSSSPQSRGSGGLLENGDGGYRTSPPSLAPTPPPRTHAPVNPPPADDMEPQSISFIGSGEEDTLPALGKVQITSGNRTYRVSSPTKNYVPIPGRQSTQETREQGFYISFDDDHSPGTQPRRPKPPLRTKRNSPKKERALTRTLDGSTVSPLVNIEGEEVDHPRVPVVHHQSLQMSSSPDHISSPSQQPRVPVVHHPSSNAQHSQPLPPSQPIIIGGDVSGSQPDPVTLDEMERKKERIVLLSLQRRQAAEDARNRKEMEAARRREEDKFRQEERARKKEEDKRRRAAILEQHKVKKAIEEAEREGKQIDKELLACLKAGLGGVAGGGSGGGGAKMRPRTQPTRPRPKTVHMDSDITDSPGLTPSRGKKGSSSNLSVVGRPMRRDYYRGSQDCLTETRRPSSLYNEIGGEESIGTSPGRSLARRASYKTPSRDPSPDVRSLRRNRYGTYQAQRKSASLMNLATAPGGSSIGDGECDSGLGRGTRAPSPSGPGSLPLRSRMRNQGSAQFDDAASEAGSDYSGPRLYRQPATKSNKGIIVNAIEYCVFPGVVNMEMKRKALEAVNRSEAKHFLVLFRDAGCQFRALYTYQPDTEEVIKLHGIGPKQVTDRMFDKFFKYNSGGKCFSQVHTKHLTVTIDAFTIHNSLWQGKKVNLPNKADMTLVI